MSALIKSEDDEEIILIDGTKIEVDTGMFNHPCGYIITEPETPLKDLNFIEYFLKTHSMDFRICYGNYALHWFKGGWWVVKSGNVFSDHIYEGDNLEEAVKIMMEAAKKEIR